MKTKIVLVAMALAASPSCKKEEKEEQVVEQPEQKPAEAPAYIISVEDENGAILNTRYDSKLFEGTEEEFVKYELSNLGKNKIKDVKTLEGDDEEIEASTDSFNVYWQKDNYYWQWGNLKFTYTRERSYMGNENYSYNPYRRPVRVRCYRRNDLIW